jgi:starch synthase (maltosyl-transferring)
MYAGYELYEQVARPGAEEYIDNEKYEYKHRDWALAEAEGRSLAPSSPGSTKSAAHTRH